MEILNQFDFYTLLAFGVYIIAAINFIRNSQYLMGFLFLLNSLHYGYLQVIPVFNLKVVSMDISWSVFNLITSCFIMYLSNLLHKKDESRN